MKGRILRTICFLLFAVCVAASLLTLQDMRRTWDSWTGPIEKRSAADIRLAAGTLPGLDWAAYAQEAAQALGTAAYPGRNAKAAILRFAGYPDVIGFFPLSSGHLPKADELDACAVDSATAFALWNSLDVTGQRLICDKKTYNVVGVLDVDQRLTLLPARSDEEMDRLAVRSPDGYEALTALEGALGLTPDAWFFGDTEMTNGLLFACAVPLWALLGIGLVWLKRRGGAFRLAGDGLVVCAALAMLLWAVACVPVRLLPGRWSDFSFYMEQFRAWQGRELRMPGARDLMRTAGAARVLALSAFACLTLIGERMCMRCERSRG